MGDLKNSTLHLNTFDKLRFVLTCLAQMGRTPSVWSQLAGSNLATTFAGWSSMEVTVNTTGHAAS